MAEITALETYPTGDTETVDNFEEGLTKSLTVV